MSRALLLMVALLALSAASVLGALVTGTFPISARQVLDSLLYPAPGVVHDVIWRMRAPRAAAAFCCGGAAAVAGALLDVLPGGAGAGARRSGRAIGALAVAAVVAGASWALTQAAALSFPAVVLLAGGAACAGAIAARGLRSFGVTRPRWALPLAALLGGSLLTLADTMGRWLAAP